MQRLLYTHKVMNPRTYYKHWGVLCWRMGLIYTWGSKLIYTLQISIPSTPQYRLSMFIVGMCKDFPYWNTKVIGTW